MGALTLTVCDSRTSWRLALWVTRAHDYRVGSLRFQRIFSRAIPEIYKITPAADLAVRITMDHLVELRTGKKDAPAILSSDFPKFLPQFSLNRPRAIMDGKQIGVEIWKIVLDFVI